MPINWDNLPDKKDAKASMATPTIDWGDLPNKRPRLKESEKLPTSTIGMGLKNMFVEPYKEIAQPMPEKVELGYPVQEQDIQVPRQSPYVPLDQPTKYMPTGDDKDVPQVESIKMPESKSPYGTRVDGTPKGRGYFGEIRTPEGGVMTELSAGVNIDGQETLIPLLVPGLYKDEIQHLRQGGEPTPEIMDRAITHARKRISQGKSPFAEEELVRGGQFKEPYAQPQYIPEKPQPLLQPQQPTRRPMFPYEKEQMEQQQPKPYTMEEGKIKLKEPLPTDISWQARETAKGTGRDIAESGKAVLRGFEGLASNIGTGMRWLGDFTGQPLPGQTKKDKKYQKKISKYISNWGKDVEKYWERQQRTGIEAPDREMWKGSFLENPSVARGIATIAGAIPSLSAATLITVSTGSPLLGAGILGTMEGTQTYKEAREAGKGFWGSTGMAGATAVINTAIEYAPLRFITKGGIGPKGMKIAKKLKLDKKFADALVGALGEGGEEAAQAFVQNSIAKLGYDKTRKLTTGMVDGLIAGAGSGGILGATMSTNQLIDEAKEEGITDREIENYINGVTTLITNKSDKIDNELIKLRQRTVEDVPQPKGIKPPKPLIQPKPKTPDIRTIAPEQIVEGAKPPVKPPKIAPETPQTPTEGVSTPKKITTYRGSGEGKQIEPANKLNVFGEAKYSTTDKKYAEKFGEKIEKEEVELKKPYVIRNDRDLKELSRKAGTKSPVPTPSKKLPKTRQVKVQKKWIDKTRGYLDKEGYDGVIVDIGKPQLKNSITRKLFDRSQVVEFEKPTQKPITAPEPPKAPEAGVTPTGVSKGGIEKIRDYVIKKYDEISNKEKTSTAVKAYNVVSAKLRNNADFLHHVDLAIENKRINKKHSRRIKQLIEEAREKFETTPEAKVAPTEAPTKETIRQKLANAHENEVPAKDLKIGDMFLHRSGEVYRVVPTPKGGKKNKVYIQDGKKRVLSLKHKVHIKGELNDPALTGKAGMKIHGEEWTEGFGNIEPKKTKEILQQTQEDIITPVKTIASITKGMVGSIRNTFAPESISPQGQRSATIIRQQMAKNAHAQENYMQNSEKRETEWDKIPEEQRLKFMFQMESGNLPKEIQPIAKKYRKILDEAYDMSKSLDEKINYIEDYMPHMWEKVKKAKDFLKRYKTRIGKEQFSKNRMVELIEEGRKLGLKPKTTNPEVLVRTRYVSGLRAKMHADIIRSLEREGLIKKVKPKEGDPAKSKMKTPLGIFEGQPEVITTINRKLQRSVYQLDNWTGKVMNSALQAKNMYVSYLLGLSGFHASEVTMSDIAYQAMLALKSVGRGHVGTAIKRMSKIPVSPAESTRMGHKIQAAYYGKDAPPWAKQAAEYVIRGGGRIGMPEIYKIQGRKALKKAINDKSVMRVVPRTVQFALELTMKPVLEYYVPKLKIANYCKSASDWIANHPKATSDQFDTYLRKAWDLTDMNFGQVVYDNLFWRRWMRDLGVLSTTSLGWNMGTIRFGGGAVIDTVNMIQRLWKKSENPHFVDRQLLLLTYIGVVGGIGGLITYLNTGERPKEVRDFLAPKTGGIDEEGNAIRTNMPAMTKEYLSSREAIRKYGLLKGFGKYFSHKLTPMVSDVLDLLRNKDYFGVDIRDPKAPFHVQMKQIIDFFAGKRPISIQSFKKNLEHGSTKWGLLAPFLGFSTSPKYVTRTKLQKEMFDMNRRKFKKSLTKQEWAKIKKKLDLRKKIEKGTVTKTDFKQAIKDGIITGKTMGRLKYRLKDFIENANLPSDLRVFKYMTNDEQRYLYKKMTRKEKLRYVPQMNKSLKKELLYKILKNRG